MSFKRLYVFTGKGGVGKTSSAIAFYEYLKSINKKAVFLDFSAGEHDKVIDQNKVDHKRLDEFESVEIYIGRKLNSKTLAKWIVSTSFFKALINMIPGFSYLIFLGHILDMLKADPELIIVLDSPSTGHALTMLEAANNYKSIFRSGILFEDIQKMLEFSSTKGVMQINICLIPTEMACSEGLELSEQLQQLGFETQKIFMNFYIPKTFEKVTEELPDFLQRKINNEQVVYSNFKENLAATLPYILESDLNKVQYQLKSFMEDLC